MPKNMSIAPQERGWAVLHRNVLINVYPSRYLALQAVEHLREEERDDLHKDR